MAVIKVPWIKGGGNIILNHTGGDIMVSSDVSSNEERSQTITFHAGEAVATLRVTQLGNRVVLRDSNGLTLRDNQANILTAKTN